MFLSVKYIYMKNKTKNKLYKSKEKLTKVKRIKKK